MSFNVTVHIDSLDISELFFNVKMENGVFGKIPKERHKAGMHLKSQLLIHFNRYIAQ